MSREIIKKIKIKFKNNQLIVKIKVLQDVVINIHQYDIVSKNKYNFNFLKLHNIKKNKIILLGNNKNTLCERLKRPISKYDFFFIIEQIVDIVQKLKKVGLSYNNLVLDLKYVFFNETTKELSFIYLPIATPRSGDNITEFIKEIIYAANPVKTESDYLSRFYYFIKGFNPFDTDKIEAYISKIDKNIVSIIKKSNVEEKYSFTNFVANCLSTEGQRTTFEDEQADIRDNDEQTELMDDDELTYVSDTLPVEFFDKTGNKDNKDISSIDDDQTEMISDEDDKTDLFDEVQAVSCKCPTLIRVLTEEIIRIDKPVFRIGKEENCVDYIVADNIAISRSHADIISRAGKYFVFDLRSKNKSYINNRVLPAEQEVEIFNGDVLKLANEEFLFQI